MTKQESPSDRVQRLEEEENAKRARESKILSYGRAGWKRRQLQTWSH